MQKLWVDQFGFIGGLISAWWFWLVLAVITLSFLTHQNQRKKKHLDETQRSLLLLEIPRQNEKKELSAEQMFAALHGILRPRAELIKEGSLQDHLSFEMVSHSQQIRFYVSVPTHLNSFVEGQIYAQYPSVQIFDVSHQDITENINQASVVHTTELGLIEHDAIPIKTFPSFEVDPLAAVTATLAKLNKSSEKMWIQILVRPIDDHWHKRGAKLIEAIKDDKPTLSRKSVFRIFAYLFRMLVALWQAPTQQGSQDKKELSDRDRSRITAIEEKGRKLGYQVKIRVAYFGEDVVSAKHQMQAIVGSFKQFNTTNLNGFKQENPKFDEKVVAEFSARHFIDSGMALNIEELASIFHLPHTSVETPNIVWATAKTAEPPASLPAIGSVPDEDLSPFGITNFRGTNTQFGIRRADRGRHLYIIGQTGVGKSGLLELLTLSDIYAGHGFAVIDPHGDYAMNVLKHIPSYRMDDVVYFNPADGEFPIAFNPLEITDPSLKNHISSELVGVLKRMFESWGPRLEYILRYTILALLDYPNATMLDITKMLTDKNFRTKVLTYITDPVVKNFWVNEFSAWNDKFASEAIAPVLNKVGAFTANPMVRNIIGQPNSTINIRNIMDNGKILIVNLSRGLVGEDNAAILGALMVTKIQLAAMSRSDIVNIEDRRPFYLYVDEFQNFATDSFSTILSEARKYGLNLTIANQYVAQMSPMVRDAIFGNVGSIIAFRVGASDGAELQKYFEPYFTSQDLIQMHNRSFITSMSISGEKAPAFSATTMTIPPPQEDHLQEIIDRNRLLYAKPKTQVEKEISIEVEPKYRNEHNANKINYGSIQPNSDNKPSSESTDNQQRQKKQTKQTPRNRAQQPKSPHNDDTIINLR